jgi:predicted ThiF/HesA family dinucleotide-utilizing enzyme
MVTPSRPAVIVLVLTVLLALAGTLPASGEVPTAADVATCNDQALQAIKTGRASPTTGDHARAARARGAVTTSVPGVTTAAVESPDPQIHGMEGEGAKDPVYQAAFRSCMRRKGF